MNVLDFRTMKEEGHRIALTTCYDIGPPAYWLTPPSTRSWSETAWPWWHTDTTLRFRPRWS